MKDFILILSIIIEVSAYLVFIRAILKREARPHRTTRFVLLILANLAAFSLLAQGSYIPLWIAGIYAFFAWIIFILSFKYGMGGWSKADILCLIIAIIGIVLWRITEDPFLALCASIFADFIGMVPTLLKSYHKPETETWHFYFLAGLGALLNLFAIKTFVLQQYIFPLYIVLINIVTISLLLRKRLPKL